MKDDKTAIQMRKNMTIEQLHAEYMRVGETYLRKKYEGYLANDGELIRAHIDNMIRQAFKSFILDIFGLEEDRWTHEWKTKYSSRETAFYKVMTDLAAPLAKEWITKVTAGGIPLNAKDTNAIKRDFKEKVLEQVRTLAEEKILAEAERIFDSWELTVKGDGNASNG